MVVSGCLKTHLSKHYNRDHLWKARVWGKKRRALDERVSVVFLFSSFCLMHLMCSWWSGKNGWVTLLYCVCTLLCSCLAYRRCASGILGLGFCFLHLSSKTRRFYFLTIQRTAKNKTKAIQAPRIGYDFIYLFYTVRSRSYDLCHCKLKCNTFIFSLVKQWV